MSKRSSVPSASLALFVLGVAALGVSSVCLLASIGSDAEPDVILSFGGHEERDVLRRVAAFVAGTGGVVCVLRSWADIHNAICGDPTRRD